MTLRCWNECIQADIEVLACDNGVANISAQGAALSLTQAAFRSIAEQPAWVFGLAYVIYGSHNGNRTIAEAVSAGLGLVGDAGTSYLRATGHGQATWPYFKAMLDRTLTDRHAIELAVAGALDTFKCFQQIFEALGSEGERRVFASAVNPEAGDHPVPADEQLALIATEVGRHCHAAFGYLDRRFGNRGEAFARSDGAWLVTLCDIPLERAEKQVDWLSRVLSSRGIPSICLDYHLSALHRALMESDAMPGRSRDRLPELARRVRLRRSMVMPEMEWDKLTNVPVPALDPLGAAILVSAIIDQRSGLARCVESIANWLRSGADLEAADRLALLALLHTAD